MSRLLRAGPLLVGLALLLFLAWRFGMADLAAALARLSALDLTVYLALTAGVVFGYAWRWQLVLRSLGGDVALGRCASARLAADAVSNIVPSARLAGEPVRAAIVHAGGIDATVATAGVTLDRMLETVANIVCALLYVSVFSLTHSLGSQRRSLLILTATLFAGGAALAIPLVMLWRGQSPLQPLRTLFDGGGRIGSWLAAVRRTEDHVLRFFRERPAVFLQGLVLSLAVETLTVCQYHFLFTSFGVHVDLPTLFLALVGTGVAHALPTPGALGTLEGTQVAVLTLAVGDPSLGFLVGLIMRLQETLLTLAGLVALSLHGLSLGRLPVFRGSEEASV